MNLIAVTAPIGRAFDTSTKLVRETAKPLWDLGYRAVARYLSLPGNSTAADIDARELAMLTDVGFAVWLVQHVRAPGSAGWLVRDFSGARDAMTAAAQAKAAGYPAKAHLAVDLEGINGTADQTREYAESWLATVRLAGYSGMVYVGYQCPLGPQELWLLHNCNSYWSDAGPRAVSNRGFAIKQGAEHTVAGVRIDEDAIAPDELGELPLLAAADPEPAAA